MAVQLYNTLTRRKEPLETLEPGRVKMYVCGVTVYDHCHLGHARAAIAFDVIRRYLAHRGYRVTFVCNFTDVDDKIIARARRLKVPIGELTDQFIGEYYRDMDALGVRRADIAPRATEHIAGMIEMIENLIEKGAAYRGGGDVYFDISRFPAYGKLSHRNLEELEAGFRVEPGEGKRNPLDFALWKASKPDEPSWESPWGPGRPGWHIECSVMSSRYLGDRFDIHGGGEDLVFPHHENEIAQSEGCFGHDWVRYWVHNGFVRINHEKMSKSKGNFFTIKSVLADTPAQVVRFFLLGTHYRHPVDYSDQVVGEAWRGLDRFYNLLLRLGRSEAGAGGEAARRMKEEADAFRTRFTEARDDDFNSARALGHLFDFARQANSLLLEAGGALTQEAASPAVEVFREVGEVFGLFTHEPEEWFRQARPGVPEEGEDGQIEDTRVEELISRRTDARRRKDFKEADRIREELAEVGILLEDGPSGTIWKRRP
ncbi:MAG: cysteine--tRNA ligase [Candidatus Tectomicrobia bacterium]|nr:cysteine--tRNA ligase [Candidatus Tectomicrobia bacterium]